MLAVWFNYRSVVTTSTSALAGALNCGLQSSFSLVEGEHNYMSAINKGYLIFNTKLC